MDVVVLEADEGFYKGIAVEKFAFVLDSRLVSQPCSNQRVLVGVRER